MEFTPLCEDTTLTEHEKIARALQQCTVPFHDVMSTQPRRVMATNRRDFVATNYRERSRPLPDGYVCHTCSIPGHWREDCRYNDQMPARKRVKRNWGIPQSQLVAARNPNLHGVRYDADGNLSMPAISADAYMRGKAKPHESTWPQENSTDVPEEFTCPMCNDLMKSAAIMPCCGYSFCDDCVRARLVETCTCPNCKQTQLAGNIVVNKQLRELIFNFRCGKHWLQ